MGVLPPASSMRVTDPPFRLNQGIKSRVPSHTPELPSLSLAVSALGGSLGEKEDQGWGCTGLNVSTH